MRRGSVSVLMILAVAGCVAGYEGAGRTGVPGGSGGKADGTDSACPVTGTFEVTGGFAAFSKWSFSLDAGALTDSHTDALAAADWPTHLLVSPTDASRLTLVQITDASGAIVETTLQLQASGCDTAAPSLAALVAYEVSLGTTGSDSLKRVAVTLRTTSLAPNDTPFNAAVRLALADSGVGQLPFTFDPEEIARQEALMPMVMFDDALRAALKSFIEDGEHPESPIALVQNIDEDTDPYRWAWSACPGEMETIARVRCFMNQPDAKLTLLPIGEAGEGGDPVDANRWIFRLNLPLSDHLHWAEVNRHTASAFNWGFN